MKKLITLGIFSLFSLTLFAQKLDYDTDSKWFLGLNLGATWNTTDVKNKTNIGYGLTLGRALNYNYGKKVSYDLRLRYLYGNWYGQDYDTTSVLNNPAYDPMGNVVQTYDTLGYTINNFQTEVHELGLELVIHANGLRENTGWDPYIFGGANIVWGQTMGDLYPQNQDSSATGNQYYPYSPSGISKAELNALSDDIYDSALDGSKQNDYTVGFMPSLGIGLAYQVGPRFAIGVEHKTTFALRNTFDGYADTPLKWGMFENDIYHYTSAFLKFNFKTSKNNAAPNTNTNTNTNNTNGIVGGGGCLTPEIAFIKPRESNLTVTSNIYVLDANIDRIAGRENVQLTLNGNSSTNFVFNTSTKKFESSIILIPGENRIVITAGNACGSESQTVIINYAECTSPIVNFTNPSATGVNVSQAAFVVNAKISNAVSVQYQLNGANSSNFVYNAATGDFSSSVQLVNGVNSLRIIATNACGTTEQTVSVNYSNCPLPFINFGVAAGSVVVNQAVYIINATIDHIQNQSNLGFRLNGVSKTFTYNSQTKKLQATVTLAAGVNTIQITANNNCGNDVKTLNVEYAPCVAPQIALITPPVRILTVQTATQVVKFKIPQITSINQVQLLVNGVLQPGGLFNATSKIVEYTVSLNVGSNVVKITAITDCGTDTETITIQRETPVVTEQKITICHYPPGNTGNPQQIEIPLSAWPAHQAHGDVLGPCPIQEEPPVVEQKVMICHYPPGNTGNPQQIEIPLSAWPAHQAHGDVLGPCPIQEEPPVVEQKVMICHYPPGNTGNPQQIEIPLSAWPAHQAHGDVLGPCPIQEEPPVVEQKVMICHYPPGNTGNPQQIEIPLSAWPAHQAHGDVLGPCPIQEEPPVVEQKVMICHYPPGNTGNPQQIEIPLSAWPAHQAHGDVLGPCPVQEEPPVVEQKVMICHYPPGNTGNPQQIEIPLSAWPAHQAHGDVLGPCPVQEEPPVVEQKVMICHYPPGNTGNPQQIEIPLSAWPAHQAHGDVLGPCPVQEEPPVVEQKVMICHYPPGNTGNPQQIEIPLSAWPAHQAHGDVLGPCPVQEEPPVVDPKIMICHYPPGNTGNPQQIEIPLSAWPAHQAHGDILGPCPVKEEPPVIEKKIIICHTPPGGKGKSVQLEIPESAWPAHKAHGDILGPCPDKDDEGSGNGQTDQNGGTENPGTGLIIQPIRPDAGSPTEDEDDGGGREPDPKLGEPKDPNKPKTNGGL